MMDRVLHFVRARRVAVCVWTVDGFSLFGCVERRHDESVLFGSVGTGIGCCWALSLSLSPTCLMFSL